MYTSSNNLIFLQIPNEDFQARLKEAQRNYKGSPGHLTLGIETYLVASHIMYVDGDNTSATAEQLGYLHAKDLYPDFRAQSLEEFAKEFYGKGVDIDIIYASRAT